MPGFAFVKRRHVSLASWVLAVTLILFRWADSHVDPTLGFVFEIPSNCRPSKAGLNMLDISKALARTCRSLMIFELILHI